MKNLLLVTWLVYACGVGAETRVSKTVSTTVSTTIVLSVYLSPASDFPGELEKRRNCPSLQDLHANIARYGQDYGQDVPASCLHRVEQTEHENHLHLTVETI